jgi:hypothetical protein
VSSPTWSSRPSVSGIIDGLKKTSMAQGRLQAD